MADFSIGIQVNRFIRPLINIAERLGDSFERILRNNDKLARDIRVAIPAKVVSFDAEKQTITAQPLIREKIIYRVNGTTEFVNLPQLTDIPVQFPQAGNFVLTMPIQAGDEVMLIFQDMCIDSWWFSGGIQNWMDRRRHDLSDAIAIPGLNSVPNVISDIADDAAELRTKDGDFRVKVKDDEIRLIAPNAYCKLTNGNIVINADTKITFTAPDIEFNGDVNGAGSYLSHEHTGVEPGVGNSGGVDH